MGIFSKFSKKREAPQSPPVAPVAQAPQIHAKPVGPTSDVILRPLVTEKAAVLGSANTYIFVVRKDANRVEVRSAIKQMYGVTPMRVNIQNVEGKWKRFGRSTGKRQDWKKALVTLPKGKTIQIHEGV